MQQLGCNILGAVEVPVVVDCNIVAVVGTADIVDGGGGGDASTADDVVSTCDASTIDDIVPTCTHATKQTVRLRADVIWSWATA